MGVLTGLQLVNEVISGLGNRADVTNDRVVLALNIAQARVSRFWDFQELKLTATAPNNLTTDPSSDKFMRVPTNLKTVHTFVLLDSDQSRKLTEKPWRMFDKFFPSPETDPRERSVIYSRWGFLFILYPVPDNIYTFSLKFTARPTPFTTASLPTQVSDYDEKDDILIELALEYFWRSFGRYDKADQFLKMAYNDLETAKSKDDLRPDMSSSPDDLGVYTQGDYWNNPFVRSVIPMG